MPNLAAPNMTAVGAVSQTTAWNLGALPVSFGTGAAFSLEAWVMLGLNSLSTIILAKDSEFTFGTNHGILYAGWGGGDFAGTTQLSTQVWHYVAVTYDGTTLTIYLDGAVEAAFPYSGPGNPPTGSSFIIGNSQQPGCDPFDVWSVTLYTLARTAAQEADAPLVDLEISPGLVAYFDFSIAPPNEIVASFPIVPLNGAVSQTLAPAIAFDGSSSGLVIGQESGVPSYSGPFSASAWVYFNGGQGGQTIFASGDQQRDPATLQFGYLGLPAESQLYAAAGVAAEQAFVSNPGDWHNVAVTYDGQTSVTLYLDGQVLLGLSLSAPLGQNASPVWTAGYLIDDNNKVNWFNGNIQWLSVWNRCLSPNEVVFQQYESVSYDTAIMADISLDAEPPTDLANLLSIDLGGAATPTVQRITVTNWTPPPEQLNPPLAAVSPGPVRLSSVDWPTPVGGPVPRWRQGSPEELLEATVPELEANLAKLGKGAAALLREYFELRTREASESAGAGGIEASPWSWRVDGNEMVFGLKDVESGVTEDLLRVPVDAITACQMWWMSFLATLLSGVLNLIFISFRGKDLTEWIQRRLLNNQTVMEALATAWAASPGFTGFTVVKLLGVIYQLGLMRNFIWFVAYKAGYLALFKLFSTMAGMVVSGGATAVLFAANAALLAVQLALQITGAPNIPSYSSSCGSQQQLQE